MSNTAKQKPFSAIPLVINLVQPSRVPPTYPTVPILINALAVLGNLATDASLRQKILDSCGYTADAVGAMKETKKGQNIPTVITFFAQLLDEDADIRESTAESADIMDENNEDNNGNELAEDSVDANAEEPLALFIFMFSMFSRI